MHPGTKTQTQAHHFSIPRNLMLAAGLLLVAGLASAQSAPPARFSGPAGKSQIHRSTKKKPLPQEVVQAPAPPPMPHWPVNDNPNPPSVVWDASGLRISASNSSLQQILNEVSTDTGTKVVGNVPDQRVFGSYGPGQASDVLLQLLQGSGFNVLLAGDLGHGAPSQIVLTPRRTGAANAPAGINPQQPQAQQDQDDTETVDQQEPPEQPEETVPAIPPTPQPNQGQPGMPPNGPMRTPQEIMQEMQQRQLQQQQQMQQQIQQQQQQGNPTAPQQENPE
jgi:hypothetical protein